MKERVSTSILAIGGVVTIAIFIVRAWLSFRWLDGSLLEPYMSVIFISLFTTWYLVNDRKLTSTFVTLGCFYVFSEWLFLYGRFGTGLAFFNLILVVDYLTRRSEYKKLNAVLEPFFLLISIIGLACSAKLLTDFVIHAGRAPLPAELPACLMVGYSAFLIQIWYRRFFHPFARSGVARLLGVIALLSFLLFCVHRCITAHAYLYYYGGELGHSFDLIFDFANLWLIGIFAFGITMLQRTHRISFTFAFVALLALLVGSMLAPDMLWETMLPLNRSRLPAVFDGILHSPLPLLFSVATLALLFRPSTRSPVENPPLPSVADRVMAYTLFLFIAGLGTLLAFSVGSATVRILRGPIVTSTAEDSLPPFQVSEKLVRQLLVAEDLLFFFHHGVDWSQLQQNIRSALLRRRYGRGASTLTMQLAKVRYDRYERSIFRKFEQIWIAIYLEYRLSKSEILREYLLTVPFGENVRGLPRASVTYFQKPFPETLSGEEGLSLVLTIPNPASYNPTITSDPTEISNRRIVVSRNAGQFKALLAPVIASLDFVANERGNDS